MNDRIIKDFVNETYSSDQLINESVLYSYEAFKERKAALNDNFLIGETLYKEYAANYRNKVPVLCMLRNYEEFKAKQLIALN